MDPLHADQKLQQAILMDDSGSDVSSSSSPHHHHHKRKHSHFSSTSVSQTTSDTSGRFDDAEESEELESNQNGYFYDDAYDATGSVHSAKRRRSNDWPLRDGGVVYNEYGMRVDSCSSNSDSNNNGSANRRGSPRSSTSRNNSRHPSCSPGNNRARRSRFIEGSMNDRVSKAPPSIFIDERAAAMQQAQSQGGSTNAVSAQKQSGIFRFGKAIASAFNPFGMFGNVSEIWKSSQGGVATPKTQKEIMKERQKQAQKAYEELKKSGFKGTNKGSYLQQLQQQRNSNKNNNTDNNGVDPSTADQTWKAIQEKMEHKIHNPAWGHSRQDSSGLSEQEGCQTTTSIETKRHDLTASLRTSFHDLRKAKSALNIGKRRDASPVRSSLDRNSEDSQQRPPMRKQQSRKDLAKQAKLLKKVSNLEDKLERARRELRELTGEPEPPVPALCLDHCHHHPQKFVPGALPSLPSERILRNQLDSAVQTDPIFDFDFTPVTPAKDVPRRVEGESDEGAQDEEEVRTKTRRPTPGPKPRNKDPSTTTKGSPSLKRKSQVDPGLDVSQTAEQPGQNEHTHYNDADCEVASTTSTTNKNKPILKRTPPRKAKVHKTAKGDSPGSVERKLAEAAEAAEDENQQTPRPAKSKSGTSSSRYCGPGRSPPPRRSKSPASSLRNTLTPYLKARKSKVDMRATAEGDNDDKGAAKNEGQQHQNNLYLKSQSRNQSVDRSAVVATPAKGHHSRKYSGDDEENIPPVPPVPRDFLADAAATKGGTTLVRSLEMIREADTSNEELLLRPEQRQFLNNRVSGARARAGAGAKQNRNQTTTVPDDFEWPDGIF